MKMPDGADIPLMNASCPLSAPTLPYPRPSPAFFRRNARCATKSARLPRSVASMARHSYNFFVLHIAERAMSEPVSNEQLLQLFHRAAKQMMRSHHHGASADKHAQHERHMHDRDRHVRRQLLASDQASHAQGHILFILDERGDLSQQQLLDLLHIRSASLSELLFKLEKNDLILRQRDEQDKRNFRLSLTESGRAVLDGHRQHRQETAARLFSALNQTERASLAALLTHLLTLWEAEETRRGNTPPDNLNTRQPGKTPAPSDTPPAPPAISARQ
jgi:DNA-binding MarR family transcriptional regulator